MATRDVAAGEELLFAYGTRWWLGRARLEARNAVADAMVDVGLDHLVLQLLRASQVPALCCAQDKLNAVVLKVRSNRRRCDVQRRFACVILCA